MNYIIRFSIIFIFFFLFSGFEFFGFESRIIIIDIMGWKTYKSSGLNKVCERERKRASDHMQS